MRLKNDVAIVTGPSSGIGRAVALTFAKEGAKVACLDLQLISRCEDETPDTVQLIKDRGGEEAIFIKTDVSKSSEVRVAVKAAIEKFEKVNILVNCAGIICPQ